MTNDEIGQELVDRLNDVMSALGLPEEEGAAGLLLEADVHRAVALHADVPVEVVEHLIQGCLLELGIHALLMGSNLRQAFGGVAAQGMLLGVLAAKRGGS